MRVIAMFLATVAVIVLQPFSVVNVFPPVDGLGARDRDSMPEKALAPAGMPMPAVELAWVPSSNQVSPTITPSPTLTTGVPVLAA